MMSKHSMTKLTKICVTAMVLAVALAGCTGTRTPTPAASSFAEASHSAGQRNAKPGEQASSAEAVQVSSTEPVQASSTEPRQNDDSVGAPSAPEYQRGTLTETSFESSYIGVRYTLPENVVLATQDELDEQVRLVGDVLFEETSEKMREYLYSATVYEMMAISLDQMANVVLSAERIPSKNITEEQFLTMVKRKYEAQELNYTFSDDYYQMTIAGQQHTVMDCTVPMAGLTLVQRYAVHKIGNRIVAFAMTYSEGYDSSLEHIMSGFEAL